MFLKLTAVNTKFPGQLEKNNPICHFIGFKKTNKQTFALGFGSYFVFKYEWSLNMLEVRGHNASDKTIKWPYQNIIPLFPTQFFLLWVLCWKQTALLLSDIKGQSQTKLITDPNLPVHSFFPEPWSNFKSISLFYQTYNSMASKIHQPTYTKKDNKYCQISYDKGFVYYLCFWCYIYWKSRFE